MNGTNDTNMTITGSGTAGDPYVYNFHTSAPSVITHHGGIYWLLIGMAIGLCIRFSLSKIFKRKSN